MDLDGLDGGMVVDRAVRRVERGDGGLGRRRWERERDGQGRNWARRGAVDVHDGAGGAGEDTGEEDGMGDTVYVSMRDPIGMPAFKPGVAKPIPRWMQPVVSGAEVKLADRSDGLLSLVAERLESLQQAHIRRSECSSNGSTVCPPEAEKGHQELGRDLRPSSSSSGLLYRTQSPATHKGTSFVSVEPLKLPSSHLLERVTKEANLSSSTLNTYHTPPEYPSPSASFRTMSPESFSEVDYGGRGISVDPLQPTKRYSNRIHSVRRQTGASREDGAQNPLRRLGSSPHQSSPQTHRVSHSGVPLTSSEYLERYQPGKAASVSGPSGPRARGHVVAKLRKSGRAGPSAAQVTEETLAADAEPRRTRSSTVVGPSQSRAERPEQIERGDRADRADPNTKRRSVQAELRRFFGR
ncbi:hypothetical protein B0T14DRAFT_514600 [Immersiella caudata]|uniref:Uncharacterized protein n=1 Tax=Immersiella caudata TaxID=314043 RepID=A0AA39WWE9_9PEZI|nr:hypothetical protein B0T14DRAFT_514600 [Immersiella caudata]